MTLLVDDGNSVVEPVADDLAEYGGDNWREVEETCDTQRERGFGCGWT